MKRTCFANLKGGAGKTTSAVSIADALTEIGLDVLLLDLDPQGTLSAWTAQRAEGATELLTGNFDPTEHVFSAKDNLDIIPSNRSLKRATQKRPAALSARLEKLWDALKGYEVVFLDTPPQAGALVTAALMASDKFICPVSPGKGAVDGLVHLLDYTNQIGGASLESAFACNVDLRSTLHNRVPRQLIEKLGEGSGAARHFVRSTVRMQEAEAASEFPSIYCPRATAWKDYVALTDELFGLEMDVEGSCIDDLKISSS